MRYSLSATPRMLAMAKAKRDDKESR